MWITALSDGVLLAAATDVLQPDLSSIYITLYHHYQVIVYQSISSP